LQLLKFMRWDCGNSSGIQILMTDFAFTTFEKLINSYLSLDPETLTQLQNFQGKTAKLTFVDLHLAIYIEVIEKGFHLRSYSEQAVCTHIEGSCIDLLKMVSSQDKQPKLISAGIKIQGDLDFGQGLYKILREIDIDWEEHLSKIMGDNLAYQFMQQARGGLSWIKKSIAILRENTQEYIQEEARLTPSLAEIEDFYQAISQLRDDTDRLEHKIRFLIPRKIDV